MRAASLGLLGLLGLGVLGLWIWIPGQKPAAPTPGPELVAGDQVVEARPAGGSKESREKLDPAIVAQAYSLDGEGTIRGDIVARGNAVFPLEWDLVLEPDPFLKGRERAESRRIQMRAGEREFTVEHLRLGGYRVRAEAAGLNSTANQVLLVKGSSNQYVTLAFSPAGWLDGSVLDAKGAPAEGIEVSLVDAGNKTRFDTKTDGAGAYEFRALLDGDYQISFGVGGHALCEPKQLIFRAPRLSFPVETLPPTGTLAVHVIDLLGKPASGVRVTGFGHPKGALDLRSDDEGIAHLRYALPGTWEIQALDPAENLRAQGQVEVAAGLDASVLLRLAR